jgi:hypothetical protein
VFESLVTRLSGSDTANLNHGELERLLDSDGRELLRRLLQDHLLLRAEREKQARSSARGADGLERTERRSSSRSLGTLFGDVDVQRLTLVKHGIPGGLRPLDAELNLPEGKYSEGVARRLAWEVAQSSYEAAVASLRRTTGAHISKRQAEELAIGKVVDFEDYYLERTRESVNPNHLVVLSFDGSGVVMRPDSLRPETKKRAKGGRRRSTAESAGAVGARQRGVRKDRKRMAEVAAVYDLDVVPRTPEDIVRDLRGSGPDTPRPKAKNKRVWASLERSVPDVIDEAFVEAGLRDDLHERTWVAIVDGNKEQLRCIGAMAISTGVKVTAIIDFIHVLGYLWNAGKALEGPDVAAIDEWVEERSLRILRGDSSTVAAGMRRAATRRNLSGPPREAVDACANYLLKYGAYLRYHEYLARGMPIASGVIEGACRSLVKDRMDLTGARWGLEGGEAVLKLRSLRASGDLDDYLQFHQKRELQRNHLDKLDEGELEGLRMVA